jgi:predicted enzyme related to lactoylglutathione lyase
MPSSHGRFVWYELMTTDTRAAKEFYGSVVGWGTQDSSMPGMEYTMFTADAVPVGGLMTLPDEVKKMGAPPSWSGYIAVDDVDAATDRVKTLGGRVHVPPRDIPNVGRFSVVADPQMAAFMLFRASPGQDQPDADPTATGRIGWHELYASDWEKAFAFYSEMFGWQKDQAMDMGAMGTYQVFAYEGRQIGGMFNKPPQVPVNFWLYYFNVGDIDAAADRVAKGGGKILMGPMEVPGGGMFIIQGMDPQGAMFALVGKRG